MKNILLFFLALITSGCGCSNKQKNNQQTGPKLFVINVLDKTLYDDCHIAGSINVPFEEFNDWILKKLENKEVDLNDHVVVYCSNYMCTASGFSAKLLHKLGFKNVWAYEAGMAEWFQEKQQTEGVCQKPYLTRKLDKPAPVFAEAAPGKQEDDVQVISTSELAKKINDFTK